MPSPASKPPSGAASTPVTRTSSRCGTGPVAASATTAGAAGGPTTTTGSPPPSSDAHPSRYTHTAALNPWGLACCGSRARSRLRRPEMVGPTRASDVVAAEDVADRGVREHGVECLGDDRSDREHREVVELLLARDRKRVREHHLADRGIGKALDGRARQHTVAGGDVDVRRP